MSINISPQPVCERVWIFPLCVFIDMTEYLFLLLFFRERCVFAHRFSVDPVCVHRGSHQIQGPEELPRGLVSSFCCTLVSCHSNQVLGGLEGTGTAQDEIWTKEVVEVSLVGVQDSLF